MESFLCPRCKKAMCSDCKQIAEEYAELYEKQKRVLIGAQDQVTELTRQLAAANRRAASFEQVAKLGYNEVIQRWIDSEVAKMAKEG